tara:strand:- start:540 stop:761 length:222 start_codon:yes stop_codon:yes gene_type:complete
MVLNLFFLDGYGLYVWPSFIFTFAIYFYLYLITNKALKKQEKTFFKEFKQLKLQSPEAKITKIKKTKVALSPI